MEYGGLVDQDIGGGGAAALAFGTFGVAAGGDDIHDDVIEELLVDGCWVEASDNNYLMGMMLQPPPPPPQYMNMMGGGGSEGDQHLINHHGQIECAAAADQEEMSGFVVGKRWWIGPRANPGPSSSVKERLVVAVGYLKEYTKNSTNVLIQIWVPLRPRRRSLIHNNHYQYHHHHHHHTSANNHQVEDVQVRFFRSHEYPRVQAQQYGSLALPVFERGSGTCLGVLEIVITNHQTPSLINNNNYRPQLLDNLSNALQVRK